jgi:leucyl/phenylalanyl-tRNA--protein transferase
VSKRFGPDDLLNCYANGVFPMGDARDDPNLFLIDPDTRCVLPLDAFHVPRRLARFVRTNPFEIRVDTAFRAVMEACAHEGGYIDRPQTWINRPILDLYAALFARGHAHSVECWSGEALVGGLYGVSLGGAFFGESMFSLRRDASKVALVHLVARLVLGGFTLLDAQFENAHLDQFGAQSLPRCDFHTRLSPALAGHGDFHAMALNTTGAQALQSIAQTS